MSAKIAFGIIGFGEHAKRVRPAFSETEFCELVDVSEHRGDYERLLKNTQIDVIYICLPNHLHQQWAEAALTAKKHVLCEKPLAFCTKTAQQLEKLARDQHRLLVEGFMYRFHPQHQLVKRLLSEQIIGEVLHFEARYEYFINDTSNIRLRPETSGGALLDAGCYGIDAAQFVLGKMPTNIEGVWQFDSAMNIDRRVDLQFQYASGQTAKISAANNATRANCYTLTGSEGVIHVPAAFHVPRSKQTRVELRRKKSAAEYLTVAPANHFALQFDAVSRAVRSELHTNFADFVNNASLLESAAEICRQNSKQVR